MTDFTDPKIAKEYFDGLTAEHLSCRPMMIRALGDVRNLQVLDGGCGGGWLSMYLAENLAQVRAIDSSPQQIALAKERNSHPSIAYEVADVTTFQLPKDVHVDLLIYSMVLVALRSYEDISKALQCAKRNLKNIGRLIMGVLHPLFYTLEQDNSDRARNFDFKDYFNEGSAAQAEGKLSSGKKILFHNIHFSLEGLVQTIRKNGFVITNLIESRGAVGISEIPKYMAIEARVLE